MFRHPFFALTRPTGARADRGPVYGGRPGQPCREPRRPWPRGSRAQLDGSDSWQLLGRLGSGFVSRPRVLSTSGWRGRHLGATGRARGAAFAGRPSRGPPSGAGRRCWRRREARARRREPPPRRSRARSDRRRKPLGTAPHRPLRAPFAARLRTRSPVRSPDAELFAGGGVSLDPPCPTRREAVVLGEDELAAVAAPPNRGAKRSCHAFGGSRKASW